MVVIIGVDLTVSIPFEKSWVISITLPHDRFVSLQIHHLGDELDEVGK